MVAGAEPVSQTTRVSQLVAEALVEGHDRDILVQRAQLMGLSRGLTDVLIAACPCPPEVRSQQARTEREGSSHRPSH